MFKKMEDHFVQTMKNPSHRAGELKALRGARAISFILVVLAIAYTAAGRVLGFDTDTTRKVLWIVLPALVYIFADSRIHLIRVVDMFSSDREAQRSSSGSRSN